MKEPLYLKPSSRYLSKSVVSILLAALILLCSGVLLSWAVSYAPDFGQHGARVLLTIWATVTAVVMVLALILVAPYYRSLHYEIHPDEIIVHVGILTSSVKHVPFRTVTNITVKRGLLDRWFYNLGTLDIQTAGMSGTSGSEESLVGLDNVDEVYDLVVTELRRFRGGMSPTSADELPAQTNTQQSYGEVAPALTQILAELKAIRVSVENT
jgi:membrane protein YdbS with pleckstrin-like domain